MATFVELRERESALIGAMQDLRVEQERLASQLKLVREHINALMGRSQFNGFIIRGRINAYGGYEAQVWKGRKIVWRATTTNQALDWCYAQEGQTPNQGKL